MFLLICTLVFTLTKYLLALKVYCILMAKGLVPVVPYVMLWLTKLCKDILYEGFLGAKLMSRYSG